MGKSKVFYLNARSLQELESLSAHKALVGLEEAGFTKEIVEMKNVCIKTHFGALKNTRYLRPAYIRFLADKVKEFGGYPVVTESCGVGRPNSGGMYGGRTTEKEYLQVARAHGFTPETMGAPIYMLDGYWGTDYEIQRINGKHFNEVLVAGRLRESQILISAAHFKGHIQAGFGGALKNIGIGCVAKGGKAEAHSSKKMEIKNENINQENLKKLKKAVKRCPHDAIKLLKTPPEESLNDLNYKVVIDENKCRKCRVCHSYCPEVIVTEKVSEEQFIEQMIDNALGVKTWFENRNGPNSIFYINYAIDIVQQCDCTAASDTPFIADLGVLISQDPVALDQASVDLANAAEPLPNSILSDPKIVEARKKSDDDNNLSWIWPLKDEEGNLMPNRRWELNLIAAEKLGLGSRDYELIDLD
ncbi:MAG: DUF362 domain-containing protein [Promethearchaeota archaeon]